MSDHVSGEERLQHALHRWRTPQPPPAAVTTTATILHTLQRVENQIAGLSAYLLTHLQHVIDASFSQEELTGLAFELGLDPANAPDSTKAAAIRFLITTCLQHGRLDDLILAIQLSRPHLRLD